MIVMLQIEIELFGALVLGMLLLNQHKTRKRAMDDRLFNRMLIHGILMQCVDAFTWWIDGKQFPAARALNYASETLLFFGVPLTAFFWTRYCVYRVTGDENRLRRESILYAIPSIICAILVALSPFVQLVFGVTDENVYYRSTWFVWAVVLSYSPVIYIWYVCLAQMSHVTSRRERRELLFILAFPVPAILSSVMQAFSYGLLLTWVGYDISMLMLYLNVQNRQLTTDTLTHLNNRAGLERYLKWRVNAPDAAHLYAMMMDVDHFKSINDRYGHAAGDRALLGVANVLRRTCDKRDAFIARIGGDEFLVIAPCASDDKADAFSREIDAAIDEYNASSGEQYRISISYGVCQFDPDQPDAFILQADAQMYRAKRKE